MSYSIISLYLRRAQGGRDPLPLPNAYRRPLNGILNRFALKRVPHPFPTMMEPEIGLLMCSLVGLRPNSTCFDPFCGSCALLAYAKFHGVNDTVGMDVNLDQANQRKITENFCHYGIKTPSQLILGNAEDLIHSSQDFQNTTFPPHSFDFIVTDPPYGMSESIVIGILLF